MGISDMPGELLICVGGNLSIRDLFHFLSTCRRLSSLLTPSLHNLVVESEGGTSVLKWALSREHMPLVKLALSRGAETNEPYGWFPWWTLLHSAAFRNRHDFIRDLVAHNANINAIDDSGSTPLHLSASHGCTEATRALLELGADMEHKNSKGEMPAHVAARGSVSCMEAFINSGFDLNTRGPGYETVLHIAARYHNDEMVKYLLKKQKANLDINARNCAGQTPLQLAGSNSDIMRLLLRHGASMVVKDSHDKTPAHYAAHGGIRGLEPESLRAFIDAGFKLSTQTRKGQTVLHYAALYNNTQEVEYLLEQPGAGAIINAQDTSGATPLAWVAFRSFGPERESMISLLLRYGADLEIKDRWLRTPAEKLGEGKPWPIGDRCDSRESHYGHWGAMGLLAEDQSESDSDGSYSSVEDESDEEDEGEDEDTYSIGGSS